MVVMLGHHLVSKNEDIKKVSKSHQLHLTGVFPT